MSWLDLNVEIHQNVNKFLRNNFCDFFLIKYVEHRTNIILGTNIDTDV